MVKLRIAAALAAALGALAWTGSPATWRPLSRSAPLTGSFGEARLTHFHAGWDFALPDGVGEPVRAPWDGRITRIKLEWRGYGRAIYVESGPWTVVFAHLDRFEDTTLGLERTAAAKSSDADPFPGDIFLDPPVPVKAGQVVGFAGGGGVGKPHLHVETRFNGTPRLPAAAGLVAGPGPAPGTESPAQLKVDALWLVPRPEDPRSTERASWKKVGVKCAPDGTCSLAESPEWELPAPDMVLECGEYLAGRDIWRAPLGAACAVDGESCGRYRFGDIPFDRRALSRRLYCPALTRGGWTAVRFPLPGALGVLDGFEPARPAMPDVAGTHSVSFVLSGNDGQVLTLSGALRLTVPARKDPPREFPGMESRLLKANGSWTSGPFTFGPGSVAGDTHVTVRTVAAPPSGKLACAGVWEVGPPDLVLVKAARFRFTPPAPQAGWGLYAGDDHGNWLPVSWALGDGGADAPGPGLYAVLRDTAAPVTGVPATRRLPLARRTEAMFPVTDEGASLAWSGVRVAWDDKVARRVIFDPDEDAGVADVSAWQGQVLEGTFHAVDRAGNRSAAKRFRLVVPADGNGKGA